MIKVKLEISHRKNQVKTASQAGLACYKSKIPRFGKTIKVRDRLWDVSHHTTFQHASSYFTFTVDGITVGDITLGMHLTSPFYNSSQRSGRYCSDMFNKAGVKKIKDYVQQFWPQTRVGTINEIDNYVGNGIEVFRDNILKATETAKRFLKEERPFATEESITKNAPKIAQEQLRMFIPLIFPTGFVHTLNLTALAALYESSWTPAMKYTTQRMAESVLEKFPNLAFVFNKDRRRSGEWFIPVPNKAPFGIYYKPHLKLIRIEGEESFVLPNASMMHPLDKLHFTPELMDNNIGEIETEIEISLAAMGQDQRHRTVSRGTPHFTGNFYLPPIARELKLEGNALGLMKEWLRIAKDVPPTLGMILAPYGAMVTYIKRGSFNAIAHEQLKRLCWCAQEEIYHLSRFLRLAIEKKRGNKSKLLKMFEPPCYRNGKCAEGARYCGRNIRLRITGDYFPERKV